MHKIDKIVGVAFMTFIIVGCSVVAYTLFSHKSEVPTIETKR